MSVRILQGDVLDTLGTIEPGSIDCAVTSPPYWRLRSYLPADHALMGELNTQEASPPHRPSAGGHPANTTTSNHGRAACWTRSAAAVAPRSRPCVSAWTQRSAN